MNAISELIFDLLTYSNEYGVSEKDSIENLNTTANPYSAKYGMEGIIFSAQHRHLYVWRRTRHREWIILLWIPIYRRWVNDEVTLVGKISKGEKTMSITTLDSTFATAISRLNPTNQISVTEISYIPFDRWQWNDARQEWNHTTNTI